MGCLCCGAEKRKAGTYCSVKCQQKYQHESYIKRWKLGQESGKKGKFQISKHIRRYLFDKYDHRCCKCGWGIANPVTGVSPLEISHVNGDWKDNSEGNLELVCPNCHALEPTYKALNKGKGRYNTPGAFNPGNGKTKT